ncbi:MAG TPA: hypothetical protein VGO47_08745 [Chlamydiales bacterium]|nr:hypothetical protein [Chlamydiales bacterium]
MYTNASLQSMDLAFLAAKKRQSPRTGFVHFFYGNDLATDTIPFYENLCYAVALLHQKKAEFVLEAKDLIQRLLSFQTAEGNFPVYLHDFPRCFSLLLGLKVAPLLLRASAMSSMGAECKDKIENALQHIFSFYATQKILRPFTPLWEYRYQMCRAVWMGESFPEDDLDCSSFSSSDWWEYWVTKQFEEAPKCNFYHASLQLCLGPFIFDRAQNGFEPSFTLIDWACGEFWDSSKITEDHPLQIGLAALDFVQKESMDVSSFSLLSRLETGNWNLLWKDECVHSLSLEVLEARGSIQKILPGTLTPFPGQSFLSTLPGVTKESDQIFYIDLPATFELNREDLFEIAFYIDASPTISLWINELKGTSFQLGDWIQIKSVEGRSVSLRFDLAEGEADFCGHIFRSNRSNQQLNTRGESFDWKIGLRTLRRSEKCVVSVHLDITTFCE